MNTVNTILEFLNKNEVSLSFDIATSLSILIAALTVVWGGIYRVRMAKKQGINERALASSVSFVFATLREFENSFSELIKAAVRFEKPVDARLKAQHSNPEHEHSLTNVVSEDPKFVQKLLQDLECFRGKLSDFYEESQMRRYSLIPLLDSTPNNSKKILRKFLSGIDLIGEVHNKFSGGFIALLDELVAINKRSDDLLEGHVGDTESKAALLLQDQQMIDAIQSITMDSDYRSWTRNFIPEGRKRKQFDKQISPDSKHTKLSDSVFQILLLQFVGNLIENPEGLIASVLQQASQEVQEARKCCKAALIRVSAIGYELLSKSSSSSLQKTIDRYNSDEFFGVDKYIR